MNKTIAAIRSLDEEPRELSPATETGQSTQERAVVDALRKLVAADQAEVHEAMSKVRDAQARISRYDAAIKSIESR